MSLVGSLEDLGLADILQIVSFSGKSGVLVLRCEDGEGRIVFREGLVHAAAVAGEVEERPAVPRGAQPAAGEPREAREAGPAPWGAVDRDPLEQIRREHVERAVARMFEWRTGQFRFDVRDDLDPADASAALATGLSPQYLTMEVTRRADERGSGARDRGDEPLAFSGDEAGAPPAPRPAVDARRDPVAAVLARKDRRPPGVHPEAETEAQGAAPRPVPQRAACSQAVIVDPDLVALEWLKSALAGLFERVHIFQAAEGGIARIRQYLSRGEVPAVLLSARAPMDPLSGIESHSELLRRLRAQVPRMPLLLVTEPGAPVSRAAGLADRVVVRPGASALLAPRAAASVAAAARELRASVAPFAAARGPERTRAARDPERLAARLRESAVPEDVLSLVLDFTAERFSRAAIFRVRDDQVEGLAQRGLPRAGGPDDEALRELRLPADEAAWFRRVIETGVARAAPPTDAGDRVLAALLGRAPAPEAYVAPIHGSGGVVALLYADNLPDGRPLPDTSGVAILLREAGLALDRAAREHAARPETP